MDEEKSLWPGRVGLLVALIVATGASLWFLPDAIHQHVSELEAGSYAGIAMMLGERVAAVVAVVFLVLYVLLLRGWGLERALTYLAVIAFVAVDADAAVVYATKTAGHERSFQYAQAIADVKIVAQNFASQYGSPDSSQEALQARAANDSRIIQGISINEAAQINRLRASYQAEMAAIIGSGVLSPRALADDVGGIKRAHARIAQARALVKKYRDAEQKVFTDTRSMVQQAQVDASVRQQLLAAFNRSLTQRSTVSEKMWDCEDQILAESDLLVQDLADSRSSWRAQGGMFLFTSHHDLNTFNAHVAKIREISLTERTLEATSGDTIVTTVQSGLPGTN